ncbi:MAG TPA: hypothetical protein VI386_28190 [Candidatus Sulfotelmatobacter sp.]
MKRKWFSLAALTGLALALLQAQSCGFNRHLTSITVQPSGATFGGIDPSLVVNFKAFGNYTHPAQTKDITDQVSWQSNTPQVATVTSSGAVSPNTNCGTSGIFATMDDGGSQVVSNSATITVQGPASLGCPQSGATANLSVSVTNAADGVIMSSPTGINCGPTCTAPFPVGTAVALTPTPGTGHTFGGWGVGCTSITSNTCSVTLNSDVTVTATFN